MHERLGVCSWSLRPKNPDDLARLVARVGVRSVQLALDPIRTGAWGLDRTRRVLAKAGIRIASGMMAMEGEDYSTLESIERTGGIRPARTWRANLASARANARLARALGIRLVTFHAGFLPERRRSRERGVMVSRLVQLARTFGEAGVRVALETGQERSETLLEVLGDVNGHLGDLPRVGVNFDPANVLLYGRDDPGRALEALLPWIAQAHVKDAARSRVRGAWGEEVPVGEGEVDWGAFTRVLGPLGVGLMIEREAGEQRVDDAIVARRAMTRALARAKPGPVGIGIIGTGFMGRTHGRSYTALPRGRARVVAVCDVKPGSMGGAGGLRGNLKADGGEAWMGPGVRRSVDPMEVLADPRVEAVSLCTPTDTHAALTIAALRAGKHVLVEKPVALTVREVERVAEATRAADRVCMPAMCMRFWPGWTWLKEAVASRRFGSLTSLVFERLGTTPGWSRGFYGDVSRSGGAIFDLHVHDADLVVWLLGVPRAVASVGTPTHVSTQYRFAGRRGLVVTAEGSWDHARGWPFKMRYVAAFERATAEFELGRAHPLMVYRGGRARAERIPEGAGYAGEVAHFIDLVRSARRGARARARVGMEDAVRVARVLEAEVRSLRGGTVVRVLG